MIKICLIDNMVNMSYNFQKRKKCKYFEKNFADACQEIPVSGQNTQFHSVFQKFILDRSGYGNNCIVRIFVHFLHDIIVFLYTPQAWAWLCQTCSLFNPWMIER